MIIFLYGEDSYRIREKLLEIIGKYKSVHGTGLNLKFYNAKDVDFKEVKNSFRQASMFKEKKLLVIENPISSENFKERFLENNSFFKNSEDLIVFVEKAKVKKTDKFFKFFNKEGKIQYFPILEGRKLLKWTEKEIEKEGAKIKEEALSLLVSYIGSDLWRMKNELIKLVNYKTGKVIEKEDIKKMVTPKTEAEIFKTIDILASGDKKRAIRLLENHFRKGDSPFYILKMITFQFRNLLIASEVRENEKNLKDFINLGVVSPFPAKKAWKTSSLISPLRLKKIYRMLYEVDLNIKTGKVKPEDALRELVIRI